MKKNLPSLLLLISLFVAHTSFAQVTLVSDNTNIRAGFVLPNNKPLLISHLGVLYTTDGTTASVITTNVTAADTAAEAVYNNIGFFAGRSSDAGHDVELWATDGTTAGTRLIKNINATGSSFPSDFFVFNNTLYFTADDGVHGRELWSTNGTTGNATIVTDINGGPGNSIDVNEAFLINGSNVFFKATDASSKIGLYKLTTSGVSLVKNDFAADILLGLGIYSASIGNKTVFTVRQGAAPLGTSEIWVTDGTAAGTVVLKNFGLGSFAMLPQFVLFKNLLFFDGYDLIKSGIELWSTDGTAANTKLFKDLDPAAGASSIPILLSSVVLNNKLYFNATTTAAGTELWSTDGTAGNTKILKDINPGTGSSNPFLLINTGAIQSKVTSGNTGNYSLQQFYTPFNGKIYFTANDGTHGTELWSSDGTAANTNYVKDIALGTAAGLTEAAASFFTTTGIYFSANDGSTGMEPWLTDGSSAGTTPVADINPGGSSSNPAYLFIYNSKLFFTAVNAGTDTDLYKINTDLVILPTSLTNFEAALQNAAVKLNWSTETEINTDHFDVERSIDGAHFYNITSVTSKGSNGLGSNYQYADETALHAGSSTLYYRLKMVDKDTKYNYSNILKITLQNNNAFTYSLSPNPVHDQLTLSFAGGNFTQAVIRVLDNNGKPVYQKTLQTPAQASVQHNINVSAFAGGIYYVQLVIGNEIKTLKFIKQ